MNQMDGTHHIKTDRLTLRPLQAGDAPRVHAILSNWNVVKMMRPVPHPYTLDMAEDWISGNGAAADIDIACGFALLVNENLIGYIDIERLENGASGMEGELGYSLDEPYWGQGLITEAGRAILTHAFNDKGFDRLTSGHADDNPGSAKVLTKLGFHKTGQEKVWYIPRQCDVTRIAYRLDRSTWRAGKRQGGWKKP